MPPGLRGCRASCPCCPRPEGWAQRHAAWPKGYALPRHGSRGNPGSTLATTRLPLLAQRVTSAQAEHAPSFQASLAWAPHQQDVAVGPLGIRQAVQALLHRGVEVCRGGGTRSRGQPRRGSGPCSSPRVARWVRRCSACHARKARPPGAARRGVGWGVNSQKKPWKCPCSYSRSCGRGLTAAAVEHLLQELQQVVHAPEVHVQLQLAHLAGRGGRGQGSQGHGGMWISLDFPWNPPGIPWISWDSWLWNFMVFQVFSRM